MLSQRVLRKTRQQKATTQAPTQEVKYLSNIVSIQEIQKSYKIKWLAKMSIMSRWLPDPGRFFYFQLSAHQELYDNYASDESDPEFNPEDNYSNAIMLGIMEYFEEISDFDVVSAVQNASKEIDEMTDYVMDFNKDWFDEEQVNNSIGNGSVLGAIVDVLQENSGEHYIFTV